MSRTLPANFDPARPGPQALIAVGVEWCGYCKEFKPELKAWEPKLRGTRVYWVDGDADRLGRNATCSFTWAPGSVAVVAARSVDGGRAVACAALPPTVSSASSAVRPAPCKVIHLWCFNNQHSGAWQASRALYPLNLVGYNKAPERGGGRSAVP